MISKIHHIYQRSICLLICYFGKFPWYFNYFLHSCSYNFSIDFFIITDQNISSENLPSNVFIIHKTISDVNKIASKKLDLKINIQNPYKLCDFKPAYGFLFPEIINGYDFWGHGDIDIIFGDIRFFITDELLNNYDSISVPHDFVTGYFQLFRNNKKMNTLFMKSKDYKKVFTDNKHYCFDETNFYFEAFTEDIHYSKIATEVESMTHVIKRLHEEKYLNAHFDFLIIEGTPGKLKWSKGKLTYKNKFEAMLYHLIKFKTVYSPEKIPKNNSR